QLNWIDHILPGNEGQSMSGRPDEVYPQHGRNKMRFHQRTTWAFALLALTIPVHADTIYVISAGITGQGIFGTLDLTTGAFQQIGPGEPDGYFGLAPGANGSLVSFTYASNLDGINPATGVPTDIGATGL